MAFNYKGYQIIRIDEGQFQFAVIKNGKTYNKFLTETSAKHWITTVG